MDISTYNSEELTLQSSLNGLSFTLTSNSTVGAAATNLAKTICVMLSTSDVAILDTMSICLIQFGGCSISFTSSLVSNYVASQVMPGTNVPVSRLRGEPQSGAANMPSNMGLSISYIGCDVEFSLKVDEVYIVRPTEYITRVSCSGSTVTYGLDETRFDDAITEEENGGTSVSFPNGIPSWYLGLFTCVSGADRTLHYIVDSPTFVGIPSNTIFSTQLYNSLTIPFYFGSDPQLNLMDPSVEINLMSSLSGGGGPSPPDPTYRRLSPYRGEVFYLEAPYSISTMFTLSVLRVNVRAMADLHIGVTPPFVNITPSAIALLPDDTTANLQCITNNPRLPVFWTNTLDSNDARILSSTANLTVMVPPGGLDDETTYYCAVRDPEDLSVGVGNRVASTRAVVTNIPEPLSVFDSEGESVTDQSTIVIVNRLSGNLTLRCLGHAPSNVRELVWISEQQGQPTVTLRPEANNNYTMVSYGTNEANLTINNFLQPYRGTLRCLSAISGLQVTIFVTGMTDTGDVTRCPGGDADPRWGIEWAATEVGRRDSQPCPVIDGMETTGFAFRRCGLDGEWEEYVDVINCRSAVFDMLGSQAADIFESFEELSESMQTSALTGLTGVLLNVTAPREGGLFPRDLNTSLSVAIQIVNNQVVEDIFDIIDNMLDESNVLSWTQLNEIARGGRDFLPFIERFSMSYILDRMQMNPATTRLEISRENLYVSGFGAAGTNRSEIEFPDSSAVSWSNRGQVRLPLDVLAESSAQAVVGIAVENLQNIVPQLSPEDNDTVVKLGASIVLSVSTWPSFTSDFATGGVYFDFNTDRLLRVRNPRCYFWNTMTDSWDDRGVETTEVTKLEIGEYKTFNVQANSSHLTAFAVLVDQDANIEAFEVTVQFYVGCGVVILGALLAVLALFLSCCCDKLRKYSVSAYLTHMSLCITLICSYIPFLAGLELALENMIGCIATAALLHYFFTAAFAWLFCEVLAIVFFPWVSKNPVSFLLFFVLGWGLPVIPVAISLGLFREDYVSTTHCWFFFDGEFVADIVIAFIIPLLALTALIFFLLMTSCCTNCSLCRKRMHGMSKAHVYLLSFEAFGIFLLWLLLSASWVFAMLHVNGGVGSLGGDTAGWVFMGMSIALGFWIFLFSALVSIINQKVDYEVMWEATDGLKTFERKTVKQSGYALPMSDLALSGSTSSKGVTKNTSYFTKQNPLLGED